MNLTHKAWMLPASSYTSMAGSVLAAALIFDGVSAWWLLASFVTYFAYKLCLSVGHHRLFTHRSFECSRWLEILLALGTVPLVYGSTIGWATIHIGHHKFSDSDRDPHETKWTYFLTRKFHSVSLTKSLIPKRLLNDPLHQFIHRYYVLIWAAFVIALIAMSPLILLFCYVVPMAYFYITTGMHQVLSHVDKRPRNMVWLEFLFPTGGEWYHEVHHADTRKARYGKYDLGGVFIEAVRK